ncbi:hypothetical protein GCM10010222_66110 [Streptomyces tanashiensis]|nr:hypothetical protein GCM10010222_66110 [Streptomyces tanashiensis]
MGDRRQCCGLHEESRGGGLPGPPRVVSAIAVGARASRSEMMLDQLSVAWLGIFAVAVLMALVISAWFYWSISDQDAAASTLEIYMRTRSGAEWCCSSSAAQSALTGA